MQLKEKMGLRHLENGKERKESVVARREEWREKDENKGAGLGGSREGVAVEHFLDHCQASHTAASQPQGKVTVSTPAPHDDHLDFQLWVHPV